MAINYFAHCAKCHNEGVTKYCSKCKYDYYCSPECQAKDWPRHKQICKQYTEKAEQEYLLKDLSKCISYYSGTLINKYSKIIVENTESLNMCLVLDRDDWTFYQGISRFGLCTIESYSNKEEMLEDIEKHCKEYSAPLSFHRFYVDKLNERSDMNAYFLICKDIRVLTGYMIEPEKLIKLREKPK